MKQLTTAMSTEQFNRLRGAPMRAEPKGEGKARRPGRGVRPDNTEMNGTEKAYSLRLDAMKAAGEIFDWKFHAFTLTIAEPPNAKVARWTPDFAVWTNDMVLEFHEVKGFMQDHAIVRIKAAAANYPHPIRVVKRQTKKQGGGWEVTQF